MSSWFKREKDGLEGAKKRDMPEGVWVKCAGCGAVVYSRKMERNFQVCPECGHHHRLDAIGYIRLLTDEGTFNEFDAELKSLDPLGFRDSKKYVDRISASMKKTGRNEAVITGFAELGGHAIVLGVMDFEFLGGSVGSVVGEKIARAIDRSLEGKRPLVLLSCSGGMRMQEGMLSLMQMAKTSARLTRLARAKIPFISVLTDPTTGGTTASFSMLGDVNIAEPGALIGFAGPRVIKQTIGQDLPEGFQRSEFLLDTGFLDQVVPRLEMKARIADFLSWTTGNPSKDIPATLPVE
ncbi:MAG: acetyl-CoA carboxylase, carboxyltransferase subunit beta [bacterium]